MESDVGVRLGRDDARDFRAVTVAILHTGGLAVGRRRDIVAAALDATLEPRMRRDPGVDHADPDAATDTVLGRADDLLSLADLQIFLAPRAVLEIDVVAKASLHAALGLLVSLIRLAAIFRQLGDIHRWWRRIEPAAGLSPRGDRRRARSDDPDTRREQGRRGLPGPLARCRHHPARHLKFRCRSVV